MKTKWKKPLWVLLASLLLLTTGLGILSVFQQRPIVRRIEYLDGVCTTQPESLDNSWHNSILRKMHRFDEVFEIRLIDDRITEDDLRMIGQISEMNSLTLVSDNITDDWLIHLEELTGLYSLSLYSNSITDKGLESISKLHSLRHLTIVADNVAGSGCRFFKDELWNLTSLSIYSSSLSDIGIKHLAKCNNFDTLFIGRSKLTVTSLLELVDNEKIKKLVLEKSRFTPDSLSTFNGTGVYVFLSEDFTIKPTYSHLEPREVYPENYYIQQGLPIPEYAKPWRSINEN